MITLTFLLGFCLGALVVLAALALYLSWWAGQGKTPPAPDVPSFMQDAMAQMDEISEAYLHKCKQTIFDAGDKQHE